MENFRLQPRRTKAEKWLELSNKSEITGFYMEKNSKFSGRCSWGCFMRHRYPWFLWCCFWSPYFFNHRLCGRPCCRPGIICISHLSSLLLLHRRTVFLILVKQMVVDFHPSAFCHVHQIYKRLHYLFRSILTIHGSRAMHWQPAVFTALANWLLAGLSRVNKQAIAESGENPKWGGVA